MPERVINGFEVVKVEVQYRAGFPSAASCYRFAQLGMKRDAVGQARQSVVMSHVRNLVSCAPPLRNVFEGYQPAIVLHRDEGSRQGAAIGQSADEGGARPSRL